MSKRIERQIDEALLIVATQAGFLYVRRRTRRATHAIAVTAAVLTGVGAATATVAAGAGVAVGAVAWSRHRSRGSAAAVPLSAVDRPPTAAVDPPPAI